MTSEAKGRLALVAGSVAFCLLVFEIGVRLVEPREVLREYFEAPDPVLNHRFIPGARGRQKTLEFDAAYAINSLGLRDAEMPREKPPGTRRILMLGDSFTEGLGVDGSETFSSQLQALLDRMGLAEPWSVVNAGVASYSPLLEYLYLKNEGLALQPDLVILNFDLSDVYDDLQYAALASFDATREPLAVRAEPGRERGAWPFEALVAFKDFMKAHTRSYNFLRRRVGGYVQAMRHRSNLSGDVRFDKYAMLREDAGPRDDRDWTGTYAHLLRMRSLLQARGIDFWISVYPYGLQVSPREWGAGRRFWGFQADRVYSTRPQQLVQGFCERNAIPVVNMCEDFVKASRATYPLYYDADGHWRASGHRVAAAALLRALGPYLRERRERPGPPVR